MKLLIIFGVLFVTIGCSSPHAKEVSLGMEFSTAKKLLLHAGAVETRARVEPPLQGKQLYGFTLSNGRHYVVVVSETTGKIVGITLPSQTNKFRSDINFEETKSISLENDSQQTSAGDVANRAAPAK